METRKTKFDSFYKTNFSKDLVLKNKKTIFLRIENRIDNNDISDARKLWIAVIPESTGDQFKINMVSATDLTNEVNEEIITNSELFNLTGSNSLENIKGFSYPPKSFWREVNFEGKTDFRVDYFGISNEILKLRFLFSSIDPDDFDNELPKLNTISTTKAGDVIHTETESSIYVNSTTTENILESKLTSGIKSIHEKNLTNFNHALFFNTNYKFDYKDVFITGYATEDEDFSRNYGNWLNHPISEKEIVNDKSSFGLMRTNPKLSGNIKITIDKNQDLWLDTIDANDALMDSKLKRIKLNSNSSYPSDIKKFISKIPGDVLFDLYENDKTYENTKRTLSDQHDLFYSYGVQQNDNEFYDEDLSFFAPIWLKKELPEYFVIFKVDHSVSLDSYKNKSNKDIVDNILGDAELIKTYDMRKGSKLGTYIRNITNNSRFSEQPLFVNYEKDSETTWSGIDYKYGVMTTKSEYIFDNITQDSPIKEFEEFITNGFERNDLICSNLLNLSFLFDDETSDFYEINRYLGFYVNAIELATFRLDKDEFKNITDQTSVENKNKGEEYNLKPFLQQNENGIILPVNQESISGKLPLKEHVDNKTRFLVIQDRNSFLKRITDIVEYREQKTGIQINDDILDISRFLGITELSHQFFAEHLKDSHAQMVINIDGDIKQGEIFKISLNVNNKNVTWEVEANDNGLEQGNFWKYPVYDVSTNTNKNVFSHTGELEDIAKALAGAFNSFENRIFNAYAEDENIYFITKNKEENSNKVQFERILSTGSYINAIKFYDIIPEFVYNYNVDLNECNLIYEIDKSKISVMYTEYTVNVSNFKWGSPSNDLFNLEVYRNDGTVALDAYVKIGEEVLIDDFLTLKASEISENGTFKLIFDEMNGKSFFKGANEIFKNRIKIDIDEATNLSNNDWFQTQFEKFEKLKEFKINNQSFYHLPYLDEPIFENGILTGFNNIDNFAILQLDNENTKFYLDNENYIVSFHVFNTPLSVLSFFNVKDFDFDFLKSDYAYSPLLELDTYFGDTKNGFKIVKDNEYELTLFNFYKKTGNANLKLFGLYDNKWEEILDFIEDPYLFNTFTPNTIFESPGSPGSPGSPAGNLFFNKLYKRFKIKVISGEGSIMNFSYFQDKDLNNFQGFSFLRDFWYINDEQIMQNLISENNFDRFLYKMLFTEYDKLAENSRIEFATTSKVVPFINKWVQEGTDARDNKYRLNVSSAFGYTNFCPDYFEEKTNPHSLTHEWNYIDRIPKNYDQDSIENIRSYFFDRLDNIVPVLNKTWYELFHDNDKDWFTKYFTIGYPTEKFKNVNVVKRKEERFSTISYDSILDKAFSLFRGAKFSIIETDEENNKVEFSQLYNDYKFASILTLQASGSKISTEIIDNRKFKTLLIITKINSVDYKFENNLDFVSLYSTKSTKREIQMFDPTNLTINLSETDVSLDNKNYIENFNQRIFENNKGGALLDYADVKLLSNIDISSYARTNKINENISDYDVTFEINTNILDNLGLNVQSEIKPVRSQLNLSFFKNTSYMFASDDNEYYQLDPMYFEKYNISSFSSFNDRWPSGGTNNRKPLTGVRGKSETSKTFLNGKLLTIIGGKNVQYTYAILGENIHTLSEREMTFPLSISYVNSETFYLNGGLKIAEIYINELSFSKMIKRLENDKNLTYSTINEDESIDTDRKFEIEFIETDKIFKTNLEHVEIDTDKPVEYLNVDVIGFDGQKTNEKEVLYRHRGNFEPKTRNILDFWVRENDSFSDHYGIDFLGTNTRFLSGFKNFGTILNKFSNKIADNEIMKVSRTSNYKSLYPHINETTLYAKDYFTFLSSWDHNYYDKFNSIDDSIKIDGTNDLTEKKSFFGSKVMKIPKVFEFETFNDTELDYKINSAKDGKEIQQLTKTTEKELKDLSNIIEINSLKSDNDNPQFVIKRSGGSERMVVSLDYLEKIIGQPIKVKQTESEQTKKSISITVNAGNRLIRDMLENNALSEFEWLKDSKIPDFVNLTSHELEIKTQDYIEKNILSLYEIYEVKLFSKSSNDKNSILLTNVTKEELLAQDFTEDKGIKVEEGENLVLKIEKILDSKDFKSFILSISIKRI